MLIGPMKRKSTMGAMVWANLHIKFLPKLGLGAVVLSLIAVGIPCAANSASEGEKLTVYVAGSLAEALQAAIGQYQNNEEKSIALVSGLSGDFAKKIENGASVNIFVSSSPPLVTGLVRRGLVDQDAVASPIANGLVLIAPANSALNELTISSKTDFLAMLGPDDRIATGDPDYVTLGLYAMQALSNLRKWAEVRPKIARAPDVQSALELVEQGKAALGINFSTAAIASKKVKILGRFPANTFGPIRYSFAIVKAHNGPSTRRLFNFLTSATAVAIYARYGFVGEEQTR